MASPEKVQEILQRFREQRITGKLEIQISQGGILRIFETKTHD